MTHDFRRGLMTIAKDLSRLGELHPDSEPGEVASALRNAVKQYNEIEKQYNELEKKHNQLKAKLRKLVEEKEA